MAVCGGLAAMSLALRLALVAAGAPVLWATLLTPARMDALAVGAWVALAARGGGGLAGLVPLARRVGLGAAVMAAALYLPPRLPWPGEFLRLTSGPSALALLFGSVLVLGAGRAPGRPLARLLGGRFLTTFGAYSYALYLFHNPIQAALRDTVYGPSRFPTALGSPLPGQILFYLLATAPALGLRLAELAALRRTLAPPQTLFQQGKPDQPPRRQGRRERAKKTREGGRRDGLSADTRRLTRIIKL